MTPAPLDSGSAGVHTCTGSASRPGAHATTFRAPALSSRAHGALAFFQAVAATLLLLRTADIETAILALPRGVLIGPGDRPGQSFVRRGCAAVPSGVWAWSRSAQWWRGSSLICAEDWSPISPCRAARRAPVKRFSRTEDRQRGKAQGVTPAEWHDTVMRAGTAGKAHGDLGGCCRAPE